MGSTPVDCAVGDGVPSGSTPVNSVLGKWVDWCDLCVMSGHHLNLHGISVGLGVTYGR